MNEDEGYICTPFWPWCQRVEKWWDVRYQNRLCARQPRKARHAASVGSELHVKQLGGCARSRARAHFPVETTVVHVASGASSGRTEGPSPEEEPHRHLRDTVRGWPPQASRPFDVPATHGRTARTTMVQLSFGTLSVLPPRFEQRCGNEPLEMWAMRVWEEQTPAGEEPLEWIPLTWVPTTTLEQGCRARQVVRW
jgi:hypothetical protein